MIWGNLEYKIIKKEKIVSNILMEGNGSEIRKKEMEKGGKEMINQQKQYKYQYSITSIVTPFTSSLRSKSSWLIIHRCSNKKWEWVSNFSKHDIFLKQS